MEELSERDAYLQSVRLYLTDNIKRRFPDLASVANELLHCGESSSVESLVSHLKAIGHYIKVSAILTIIPCFIGFYDHSGYM